jgi:hypothetical protein
VSKIDQQLTGYEKVSALDSLFRSLGDIGNQAPERQTQETQSAEQEEQKEQQEERELQQVNIFNKKKAYDMVRQAIATKHKGLMNVFRTMTLRYVEPTGKAMGGPSHAGNYSPDWEAYFSSSDGLDVISAVGFDADAMTIHHYKLKH